MKKEPEHPSHGLAVFSIASSNGSSLFGSPLQSHFTLVRLSISSALIVASEGEGDRYLNGTEYIEIELSSQQFGELISRQNFLPGIPCTIRRLHGKSIDSPPPRTTTQSKINADFKGRVKKLFKELGTSAQKLEQVLAKPAIAKRDREQIREIFEHFRLHIEHNLPFAIELFTEATHDTVAAARQEISQTMRTLLQVAGFEHLSEKQLLPSPEPPHKLLPEDKKDT